MSAAVRYFFLLTVIGMIIVCADGYADYQLVWSDEFEGSSLNALNWSYDIGDGCPELCGWGNNELEYYRTENVSVSGGYLTIEAREESYAGHDYTSGKIHSRDKQEFLYGKMEARMKLPTGQGIWPAFWMMPADSVYGGWAASGEIDIMEMINQATRVYGTLHYGGSYPNNDSDGCSYSNGTDFSQDFHVYSIEWEPTVFRWYVDGQLYCTKISWWSSGGNYPAPFDQPFYFILNLAVGGNWPGYPDETTVFPQQYVIDWVRVYQNTSNIAPAVSITNPIDDAELPAGDILIEAGASDSDGSVTMVEFYEGGNYLGEDTTAPYSFNWTDVPDGCYTVTAKAIDDVGGSGTDTINITVGAGCGQMPFYGTPFAIPGRIQAEDFDTGGESVAYHDEDTGNNGNQYRTLEDVDIQECSDTERQLH